MSNDNTGGAQRLFGVGRGARAIAAAKRTIDAHITHGTPADVRAEVARRVQDLGQNGGYMLGAVHNIQPDVPPENIVALFDAIAP